MNKKLLIQRHATNDASQSAKEESINAMGAEYLKRADQILVQQHVVRRFKLQQKDSFNTLLALRRELDDILTERSPPDPEGIFTFYPQTRLLCCCMNLLQDRKTLELLNDGKRRPLQKKLRAEIDESLQRPTRSDTYFNDDDINDLLNVLLKFRPDITDIIQRCDYFKFYSAFSMSSLLQGEKFYSHYLNAKRGRHKTRVYLRDSPLSSYDDALWMLTEESRKDKDFSAFVETTCFESRVTSTNVQTFGGSQHAVSVNGVRLKDRLILSVPTAETPDRIDEALREFRRILIQEFVQNCGGYYNVSSPPFDDSIFMTQFTHEPCLLKGWDQLQRQIVGLWAWDIIYSEGKTVTAACTYIAAAMAKNKKETMHGIPIYLHNTIKSYYEMTSKEIAPRPPKKLIEPTLIDTYLLGRTSGILS